jgi:hypothetical protein
MVSAVTQASTVSFGIEQQKASPAHWISATRLQMLPAVTMLRFASLPASKALAPPLLLPPELVLPPLSSLLPPLPVAPPLPSFELPLEPHPSNKVPARDRTTIE